MVMSSDTPSTTSTSWLDTRQASLRRFAPMNCEATTAPPVASAENSAISTLQNMSTSETPEIAASPSAETITVSAMPTKMLSVCSIRSGKSSLPS